MSTPLPPDTLALLTPPDPNEVAFLGRGVVTAASGPDGLTTLQQVLVAAQFAAMTGVEIDPASTEPITAEEFAAGLARRNEAFRTRILQVMLLCALTLRPLPSSVMATLREFAAQMSVADGVLDAAEALAADSLGLVTVDFDRNGYAGALPADASDVLGVRIGREDAWGTAVDDPALAARWRGLRELPNGTLGREVADFYTVRGFAFPGEPGSAPPLLAQHDWVHVLAEYGTTVESELEVFGLIARANDDPRGFSLLAMVVSLFETGALARGAGLFEADAGHLSREGMAVRLSDAMRRGALVRGSVDFLDTDWFAIADEPVAVARDRFGLPPRGDAARRAGSVGPWERGGISAFQVAAGRAAAAAAGRPYDSCGAQPA